MRVRYCCTSVRRGICTDPDAVVKSTRVFRSSASKAIISFFCLYKLARACCYPLGELNNVLKMITLDESQSLLDRVL